MDVFQNSISNEFSILKSLPDDSSLLVALYTRYKKCVDSGGDDCLEVAIGTIKEFFQQAQSNTDAKLTEDELLDLYEDYYDETTQLEWVDTTWDEYMTDLEKSELNRLMGISQQQQQEQDIDEEEADKDEGFEIPEQIEPPEDKIEPDKEDIPQEEEEDDITDESDYIISEMPTEQELNDYLSSRNDYWNDADSSLMNGFYTEVENQLQESKSVNITEYYDELETLMAEIYDSYRESAGQLGARGQASVYDNRNSKNVIDGLLDSAYNLAEYYNYDFSKIDIDSLQNGNEDQQALYQSLINLPMESSYNDYTLEEFQKFYDKQDEGLDLVGIEDDEFVKTEVFQSFYELWKNSDISVNELSEYIDAMGESLAEIQSTYSDFDSQKELYDIILDYMTNYGIDGDFDPDNISYDDDNRYSVNPPEEAPTDPMNFGGGYAYDSSFGTNFMTNYEDGNFYFTKSTFQSVFPDLYNALNDAGLLETGSYNFNRDGRQFSMQTISFTDDIQRTMMTAYMAEVFGALDGMSSNDLANISGLNSDNQTILKLMYDVYNNDIYSDEQKIAVLSAYMFNDTFAMPFVNIAGAIEEQIGYAGQQGFFQNFADLQDDFYEINPDGDINDIIAYIQNNPTAYYSGEYDTDSVIDYYGEQGYIYDRDDNELLTQEEYYDKYDIDYTQIQAPSDMGAFPIMYINDGITYLDEDIGEDGQPLNPEGNRSEDYRRWAYITTNDDGTLSVKFATYILEDSYNGLYQQMRSDGFLDANGNIQGDPTAFLNVMTNLMYESYLQDGYYKDWDTTTEFWTNNKNLGADGVEDILDELVNWYNMYGSFDDLSQSTDYEEMMDAVMVIAGLNSDKYDTQYSDGIYGFYQYYNTAKYYFEQINPNYSVQDIFNYLQGKSPNESMAQILTDPSAVGESIAQYYTDEGYVVDRETGELISPDDMQERQLREEDDVYDDPQNLYEYIVNELGGIIGESNEELEFLNDMWQNWGYDNLLDYAGAMKDHFIEFVNAVMKSKSEPYTYDQLNDEALSQIWDEYLSALYLYDGELRDMDDVNMVKSISKAGEDLPEGEQLERDDVKGTQIFDDPQTIYEYMVNEFGDIIDFNKYTEDDFLNYIEDMKGTWGYDDTQTYYSEMLNHYIEFVNMALDKMGQTSTYYDISDTARATYLDDYLDALYNFDGELRDLDDPTYEKYMETSNNTIGDETNLYDDFQEEDDEGEAIDTGSTNYAQDIMTDAGVNKALTNSTGDFYHIMNEDGTSDIYYYNPDKDQYYQIAENYDGSLHGKSTEINEDNISNYDFPDSMTNDMFSELTERELQEIIDEMPQVGDHKTDVNNAINVMQITESMGEVKLNQQPDKSKNLRYGNLRGQVAFEVRHDGVSRLSNQPDEAEMIYQTEQGHELLRLDGTQRKLTTKEWKIINDSYLYDRDVSKPFIIDKLSQESLDKETASDIAYQVNYNNIYEYYFEVANKNKDFFVWLDSYKMGEEGRSYVNYRVNSKIQANSVDINSYKKTGSILDLIPSVDFQPHFTNQGSQAQEKAILETHALGIEDVNAFVLVSALCSLFSNIIMENSKHIGKNSLIQKFEGGIKNNDYSSLKDNVYTGLYKEGSQILNAINGSTELSQEQKAVLNSIFTQRSFSSMAEWEANNRYGEIVLKFFGNNDTRNHKLENNSGKVLFELGLIYISYYATMMDNDNLMGIDLNEKSNLIKITSEFLETLYPAQKYDQNLLIGIDNMMKVITNDVRNIKRGSVANEITAKDLLSDVIRQFINIAFNETPTSFNIYEFFDEEMLGHISNNFGLDMYMKIGDFDSFVDFIADGFLDSQQFNNMIKSVMTSTMGDKFSFTGNEMLETLFMSEVQAQTFINNSKFNLLIPLIHPEIVGLIPPEKVQINLWGFNYKIVGLVQYDKKTPIYDTAIQDDINMKTPLVQKEPEFITEEDAEKRAGLLGVIGTHQHEDGSYMAGESHEELEVLYDGMAVNNGDFDNDMKHFQNISKDNFKDARTIENIEHRVMVEDEEDVIKVEDSFEMYTFEKSNDKKETASDIADWKYAGILEILNTQSKDIEPKEQGSLRGAKPTEGKTLKDTLKSTITDFENIEIIYPTEGDNYVIIVDFKNLSGKETASDIANVYVAFRGSKGFFEYEDWWGETGNMINMDTQNFYSMATAGIGQSHQGFKKGYDKMKTELLDNLQGVLKSDTKLHIIGHSRGTAFADQLVEDAIRIHPKDKIKYRGYGYITHRNKESADEMNRKIEGVDYMTYHIGGDPLRLLTKVLPYYPVGSNKVITGYEEGFKGNPFYAVDVNTLQGIRTDDAGALQTGMGDMWKILRTPLASQHFITGYKNLLAQDKHEFKFKKKQEESLNTPFTYLVAGALLYGGYKTYKTIQGVKTELGITEDTLMDASMGGLDLMDEMDALRAEHAEDVEFYENAIQELETEKVSIMDSITQIYANMPQPSSEEIDLAGEFDKAIAETQGEAPPMGSFDDPAIMENGGKIDDMVKVDMKKYEDGGIIDKCECEDKEEGIKAKGLPTYECGGKVEEPKTETFEKSLYKSEGVEGEILPSYEKGGKVPDNVKNPALYKKSKAKYANMKHSAYKSSLVVKDYKKKGGKYSGKKTKKGLTRWHKEDWRTASGSKTYKKKGDIFRPTKRVSKDTPTTMGELSKNRIKRAEGEKARTGKVKKYMSGGRVSKKETFKKSLSKKADMSCNQPKRSTRDGKRKMVKACANGQEKLIHYGDSNLGVHKEDPKRKKNFRARHRCDKDPPSKLSARYWACKDW